MMRLYRGLLLWCCWVVVLQGSFHCHIHIAQYENHQRSATPHENRHQVNVPRRAVLCSSVPFCAVPCCAVLCSAVPRRAVKTATR